MEAKLDDLELTIRHPVAGDLKMSHVFVYPDLVAGRAMTDKVPRTVAGEGLVQEILARKHVVVMGTDKSGKTALAKKLFKDLHEEGFVPLFVDGRTAQLRPKRINSDLSALCEKQYGPESVAAYQQLDRARRVIIVDSPERFHQRTGSVREIVDVLCQAADHVVLFSNDLAHVLSEAAGGVPGSTGIAQFSVLHLQPFGHAKRHELAEKWLLLDPALRDDTPRLARRLMEAKRIADTTIGRNFVPSFPVFLLPLLLAHEQNQQVDLSASTYGYFYELLIRRSLAEGTSSQEELDIRISYLTFLAGELFEAGKAELPDDQFREIHGRFEEDRLITLAYGRLQGDLIKRGILYEIEGMFGFRYKYIYYYFVARYLADSIECAETQATITRLCGNLAEEEDANVLLFLAHLSKHPSIINGMLTQAATVFSDFAQATLQGTLEVGIELERVYEELVYEDRPALEGQRAEMRRMDERDKELHAGLSPRALARVVAEGGDISEMQAGMDALDEVLKRFSAATKTLQILGQTVKNFPGSMRGPEKLAVVEASFCVGLRTLEALLEYVLSEGSHH